MYLQNMSIEEKKRFGGQHSPSPQENRILEHKIDLDDLEHKEMWRSCFSKRRTDSRLLKFIGKFVFTSTTLAYCFYGLRTADDCSSLIPFYTSLIGGVVGSWLNLPKKKK